MAKRSATIPLRGRKSGELTNPAALAFLRDRDRGELTVPSWAALGDLLGWSADRTRKAADTWKKRGTVKVMRDGRTGPITIIAPPAASAGLPGKTRNHKPENRRRRSGKSTGKKPAAVAENTAAADPELFPKTAAISESSSQASERKKRVNALMAAADESAARRTLTTAKIPPQTHLEIPPANGIETPEKEIEPMRLFFKNKPAKTLPAHDVWTDAEPHAPPATVETTHTAVEPAMSRAHVVMDRPRSTERSGGRLDGMALVLWAAAIILTCFGVTLAINGFRVLLPGWPEYAAGLAMALEFTRLLAIGYFTSHRKYLGALVGLLMAGVILLGESVSLVGGYSELQNLHQGDRPAVAATAATGTASANAQVEYQRGVVADLDRQIANLDANTGKLVDANTRRKSKSGGRDARGEMTTSDRQRTALAEQRRQAAQQLAKLQGEAAKAAGNQAVGDPEAGPVRQLAALLSVPADVASRYWLLAITILVGPAAGVLVAAASRRRRYAA